MKKLIAIICVLLIIFISMFIYQNKAIQSKKITVEEVAKIEEYIKKIYLWKEVTNEALPKFENINEAPEDWIWENIKKNVEEYEMDYEQINQKAKELFGTEFSKEFPIEGNEKLIYEQETSKYFASDTELDNEKDCFIIKEINKDEEIYAVEIIEYLENYSQIKEDEEGNQYGNIIVKNLKNEEVVSIPYSESDTQIIENVKENSDKFTTKNLKIKINENNEIYIQAVN